MVHVGVDLHKRSAQLAVLMSDGELTQQRTWWWFVDLVERLGHHAVLSNPKQTKAIAAARLKE